MFSDDLEEGAEGEMNYLEMEESSPYLIFNKEVSRTQTWKYIACTVGVGWEGCDGRGVMGVWWERCDGRGVVGEGWERCDGGGVGEV